MRKEIRLQYQQEVHEEELYHCVNNRHSFLIKQQQLFLFYEEKKATNVLGLGLFHSEAGFIFRTTYEDVTGAFRLSAGGFGSRNYE